MASNLVGLLDGDIKVVMDPEPGGAPSPLRTSVEAWAAYEEGATHHLVLQDDIAPSTDLLSVARSAAVRFPRSAVAFYTNWDAPDGAAVRMGALAGAGWVSAIDEIYTPTLALMLPVEHAARFSEEASPLVSTRREDDAVMLDYLQRHHVPVLLAIPNLIEHEGRESIAGNSSERWRSACRHSNSDRPGSGVLTGFDAVPYYREGTAYALLLDTESADRPVWRRRHWRDAEGVFGVDAAQVDAGWHEWSACDPTLQRLQRLIDLSAVRELWNVAYLLGAASSRLRNRGWTPVEHIRSAALNTLGVGGLIPVAKWHDLHEAQPLLHRLAVAGADHGASALADAPAR
ncbi:hypothetical protein ACGH2B_29020 [Streptomyces sp. BBFR2]|uniref:hypothetical protein n=1 Tax=Streptomyces sp. BBFR2 TaxID=3372854 RepID=UPI0037DA77EF